MQQESYWYALKTVRWLVNALPHRLAVRFGGWLGVAVWTFSKKKVDEAEARCVRILGLGPTLARNIVRNSYRNMGRSAAEFLRMPKMAGEVEKWLRVHNFERLEQAYAHGRGVIMVLGHVDNWEIANAYVSRRFPVSAIGAEQRDPRITALMMELRAYAGAHNVAKGQGLRGAISCLRAGQGLGILLDQDARDKGVIVPFLGFPASTPTGLAKLAARFHAVVLPLHMVRATDGFTHDLYIEPPLQDPNGNVFGSDETTALRLCNNRISAWILEHPEQWMLWIYPRWASTLPGDHP